MLRSSFRSRRRSTSNNSLSSSSSISSLGSNSDCSESMRVPQLNCPGKIGVKKNKGDKQIAKEIKAMIDIGLNKSVRAASLRYRNRPRETYFFEDDQVKEMESEIVYANELLDKRRICDKFLNKKIADPRKERVQFLEQLHSAVWWAAEALSVCHMSCELKELVKQLLQEPSFVLHLIDQTEYKAFTEFRNKVDAILRRSGQRLERLFARFDLGSRLSAVKLGQLSFWHPEGPMAIMQKARGRIKAKPPVSHIRWIPDVPDDCFTEFAKPVFRERVYMLSLIMIKLMIQERFEATMLAFLECSIGIEAAARYYSYSHRYFCTAKQGITTKYRNMEKPRTQYYTDLLHGVVPAAGVSELLEIYRALGVQMGGFLDVENEFAWENPERAVKHNLLYIRTTYLFKAGVTYKELLKQKKSISILNRISERSNCREPHIRWKRMCIQARKFLESSIMADRPVQMIARLDISLQPYVDMGRHMNFLRSIWEAQSAAEIQGKFAYPFPEAHEATSVYSASFKGQVNVLERLLREGNDPNCSRPTTGETAVWEAASKNHADCLDILIIAGAAVNQARPSDNATPLFMASQKGNCECVQILISANADVNIPRKDGASPLTIAAGKGYLDVVKLLLDSGADVNHVTKKGATALHRAIEKDDPDLVELLTMNGANVRLKTAAGTPVEFAALKLRHEMYQLLVASEIRNRRRGAVSQ